MQLAIVTQTRLAFYNISSSLVRFGYSCRGECVWDVYNEHSGEAILFRCPFRIKNLFFKTPRKDANHLGMLRAPASQGSTLVACRSRSAAVRVLRAMVSGKPAPKCSTWNTGSEFGPQTSRAILLSRRDTVHKLMSHPQ